MAANLSRLDQVLKPRLHLSGISFREAEIALRERFAVPNDRLIHALELISSRPLIQEAVLVSTCNRMEMVFTAAEAKDDLATEVEHILEHVFGIPLGEFSTKLYHYEGKDVVSHLFRVAAGLDSMVLGEPQILGQMKSAFESAKTTGTTSSVLNRLFHRAFGTAKAIRTKTGVSRKAVSLCFAAREVAKEIFGDLHDTTALLIGTGEMGRLTAQYLKRAGIRRLYIASASLERAAAVARVTGGIPLVLEQISDFYSEADIIVGARALLPEQRNMINVSDAEAALRKRRFAPQLYIDLGVPRNFEGSIARLSDAFLFSVDDLGEIVQQNIDARASEADRAEIIVQEEVEKFWRWIERQPLEEALRSVFAEWIEHRDLELEKTIKRLRRVGVLGSGEEQLRQALISYAQALLSKTLYHPIRTLKADSPPDPELLEAFRQLFQLDRNLTASPEPEVDLEHDFE